MVSDVIMVWDAVSIEKNHDLSLCLLKCSIEDLTFPKTLVLLPNVLGRNRRFFNKFTDDLGCFGP
jgi:hypothetical protein